MEWTCRERGGLGSAMVNFVFVSVDALYSGVGMGYYHSMGCIREGIGVLA